MADLNPQLGVALGTQPTSGMQTSEMKVLMAASALTTVAGIFHKQLDDKTALAFVNGLAAVYIMARTLLKAAHALAGAVMVWVAAQKAASTQPRSIVVGPMPAGAPGPVPPKP